MHIPYGEHKNIIGNRSWGGGGQSYDCDDTSKWWLDKNANVYFLRYLFIYTGMYLQHFEACTKNAGHTIITWWRHQMETFSALLALCAGNSPVPAEFPTQRPVTRSFDVFLDLHPNKWLNKQSWGWWFETLSCSLWRHCNEFWVVCIIQIIYTIFPCGNRAFTLMISTQLRD